MNRLAFVSALLLAGCGKEETPKPVAPIALGESAPPITAPLQTGKFFRFAVPSGWRIQEDGQFAVVLVAPDSGAMTVMAGNAGLPANYPPGRFLQDKLAMIRVDNLKVGPAALARPMAGCSTAWEFEYTYTVNGEACRGIAKCSVAPAYDTCTMVVTLAASKALVWGSYASWLPGLAEHVSALNGAAFGASGVMQQNLGNSFDLGEQVRQHRDWSAKTWADVHRGRAESQDRNNARFRENLGAVQSYTNPYDSAKIELPTTFSHYWVNRQGRIVGTNDPREDPNMGSTDQWSRMSR